MVEQASGERNFHVFYYLFAKPEVRDKYHLTSPADYASLSGQLWEDNPKMYDELLQAMKTVGFSQVNVIVICL